MIDPSPGRDLIRKVGTFLADLTMDRPPARVHDEIVHRLRAAGPDARLTGVYAEQKDFSSVWTAIRTGGALPATSWDTVVLPVIVHFSSRESLKANLEHAIHLWGSARTAASIAPIGSTPSIRSAASGASTSAASTASIGSAASIASGASTASTASGVSIVDKDQVDFVPGFDFLDTFDTLTLPPAPPMPPDPVPAGLPGPPSPRFRLLVAAVIAVVIVVGAVWASNLAGDPDPAPLPTSAPSAPGEIPSAQPSSTESALPSASPTGPIAVGAPRVLIATGKTQTTVTLSWQAPAEGAPAHYRVFRGMPASGNVTGLTYVVTGLSANATYQFTIRAYSGLGEESLPSNIVTVTTFPMVPLWVKPGSSVPYGNSFTIGGGSWPCTGTGMVEIYLEGRLVAREGRDTGSNFSAYFDPSFDADGARLPVVDRPGQTVALHRGAMTFTVVVPSQSQCRPVDPHPITVTFI